MKRIPCRCKSFSWLYIYDNGIDRDTRISYHIS